MTRRKRISTMAVTGILLFLGILLSASSSQDSERSYTPEGAWFCYATLTSLPGAPRLPFMDIYTPSSTGRADSGTVLCTLPPGKFPIYVNGQLSYYVSMVPAGHGNWVRTGKNKFAFTVGRILLDEKTKVAGTAKFWGTLTIETWNEFTGEIKAQFYGLDNQPIAPVIEGTTAGRFIEVEVEEAGGGSLRTTGESHWVPALGTEAPVRR